MGYAWPIGPLVCDILHVFVTLLMVSHVRCVFYCIDSWYLPSSLLQRKTNASATVALGIVIHRGSYMSAHVLLKFIKRVGKNR